MTGVRLMAVPAEGCVLFSADLGGGLCLCGSNTAFKAAVLLPTLVLGVSVVVTAVAVAFLLWLGVAGYCRVL